MPNTLITEQVVARESIMVLRNNLVMGNLVHRNFSSEFKKKGDTISIRKPAVFESKEFTTAIV